MSNTANGPDDYSEEYTEHCAEQYYRKVALRDYFAAAALQGLVNLAGRDISGEADLAYQYADAMLERRAKP